jgi:hypothetical protein
MVAALRATERSDHMTDRELDALLDGAAGGTVTFTSPDGPLEVHFDRHALKSPVAWRAALRRQLGHIGYEPPVWAQEDHDKIIRAMFMLADCCAAR